MPPGLIPFVVVLGAALVVIKYVYFQQPFSTSSYAPHCYPPISTNNLYECGYCKKKKKGGVESIRLSCGHEYCKSCMGSEFTYAVYQKQESSFKCPNLPCMKELEEAERSKLLDYMAVTYST